MQSLVQIQGKQETASIPLVLVVAIFHGCWSRSWSACGGDWPTRGLLLPLCGVCGVNPFRIDIDRFCEVIYFALISLVTDSAHKMRNPLFSVKPDGNRLVVMAK